jgi:outer membrane protein assembly factor BamB
LARVGLNWLTKGIPLGLMVLGGGALVYLLAGRDVGADLDLRTPIAANQVQSPGDQAGQAPAAGELTHSDGVPAALGGTWPWFRGLRLDAIYSDPNVTLSRQWPQQGPPVLWSVDLGEGYAGAAVRAGRVYVLDYDEAKLGDAIRCLSLADGKEIWRYFYPVKVKRNHGMSRTVPAVTDRAVVTLGPKCHVACLDPNDGSFRWGMDLVKDFHATVPNWYAGQCPLIDGNDVILGVGGDGLVMAVDCNDGRVKWQTPNPRKWTMTHSSLVPMDFGGQRMFVWCASGGVVGVSAEDGRLLWEYPDWKIALANVPTPVVVGDGRLFLSGGYNAGALMLQLKQEGGALVPEPVYRLKPEVFGSSQHTPIFYEGHLYGVRPDQQMVCLDLQGQVLWTSTPAHRFGLGPYAIANGLLYAMDDEGLLTLAEATPSAFTPLAQAKVLEGPDAWGPMAFVSGRLILRDLKKMICIDILAH